MIGSVDITMATDVYAGIAVASHNDGTFVRATLERVTLVTGSSSAKGGPSAEAVNSYVPDAFGLLGNYPNPFNPETRVRYSIPEQMYVTLVVYDVLGRSVQTLLDGVQPGGTHDAYFDAGSLPSGVYYYRIRAGSSEEVGKMMLSK